MNKATFLKEFGHLASASGGVARLREMIFNLAIRGALSPNEARGSAHDELELLLEKRTQLIAEKKYKRSPKFEKIPLKEPGFEIPAHWAWTNLCHIGEINPKNDCSDDTEAAFLPMAAIPQTYHGELEPEERKWEKIKKGFTHFANGDVVLAKITPCFENGKGAVIKGLKQNLGAGTTELHVVRPLKEFVEPEYIYIFLRSPYFKIEGEPEMTGTAGQKRLPAEYFATKPFPMPPKSEQKAIIAKVHELLVLCDQLETQQKQRQKQCALTREAALDALANANNAVELERNWERVKEGFRIFFDTPESVEELRNVAKNFAAHGFLSLDSIRGTNTEGLFNIPDSWEWTTVGELSEYITSGSRGWKKYYSEQGDTFIRSQDIKLDRLHFADRAYVDLPEKVEGKRTQVQEGDILITITGGNVGKCAQVPELQETAYVSQHVSMIRLKESKNAAYLHMWLTNSFGGRSHLLSEAYGDKPGLNLKQIASVPVPLPPENIQEQILAKYHSLNDLCTQLEKQLESLLHKKELLAEAACAAMIA